MTKKKEESLVLLTLHTVLLSSTNEYRRSCRINRFFNKSFEEIREQVNLNIGGTRYQCNWDIFRRLPESRLCKLGNAKTIKEILLLCDDYREAINEYFFDRNPDVFYHILHYFQTGKLHIPDSICITTFKDELDYFNIDESFVDSCCQQKYWSKKIEIIEDIRTENEQIPSEIIFTNCYPMLRKKIWIIMENPRSSIIGYVSIFLVEIIF